MNKILRVKYCNNMIEKLKKRNQEFSCKKLGEKTSKNATFFSSFFFIKMLRKDEKTTNQNFYFIT